MNKKVRKAKNGKMKMICSMKGTPQWSATQPKIAVPIPPIPMDSPKISPEAIAKFCGMKLCSKAMVKEFEEMIVIPAAVKKIKDHVPLV